MNICFVINEWKKINPEKDTTLRLIHECALRGHNIGIIYPRNLTIRDNITYGFVKLIKMVDKISKKATTFYKKVEFKEQLLPLTGFDAIFLRKNPPLNNVMLNFMDSIKDETFILNDVEGLRKANNKLYTASFHGPSSDYLPRTYVSKNIEYLKGVIDNNPEEKMILKPLDGYGGSGVIVIEKSAKNNLNSLLDFYINSKGGRHYIILQEYIEGAENGDIRVLMLNGQPIGAYRRVPASGELRANISVGGTAQKHVLTKEEIRICKQIGKHLIQDGIYFAGLDIINNKLIEVNVQSPGGIVNINKMNKVKLEKKVVDFIEEKVHEREEWNNRKEFRLKKKKTFKEEVTNA
ncbi:MAG: glutathione synthase [Fusobacteriota bacterium]